MSLRTVRLAALVLCAATTALAAQVPLEFQPIEHPAALGPELRAAVLGNAAGYSFAGFRRFGRDSVLLVFDDSTLTADAIHAHTWMFGPPVTAAEADSCPPEKVLGRRIARAFWRASGLPPEMQSIIVGVRGTRGIDRWTAETMYYWHAQLSGPWVGDSNPPTPRSGAPAAAHGSSQDNSEQRRQFMDSAVSLSVPSKLDLD